jgi:hypothetical protein
MWCSSVVRIKVMVANATFNNISAISWLSVLLVEESGVTVECVRVLVTKIVVFRIVMLT